MAPTDESFGQRERVCARGIYVHPTATTPNMPHTRESEELGLRDELLRDHAGDGNHGEPAVVQLLRLHRLELGRVRRRQAERVPAAVVAAQRAGLMVGPDRPALDVGVLKRKDAEDLQARNHKHDGRPEGLQRRLLERNVGRHVDVAAEEWVEVLTHKEAKRSEHRDAAVLQLDLAVKLDLAQGGAAVGAIVVAAEPCRVEEAERARDSGQCLHIRVRWVSALMATTMLLTTLTRKTCQPSKTTPPMKMTLPEWRKLINVATQFTQSK